MFQIFSSISKVKDFWTSHGFGILLVICIGFILVFALINLILKRKGTTDKFALSLLNKNNDSDITQYYQDQTPYTYNPSIQPYQQQPYQQQHQTNYTGMIGDTMKTMQPVYDATASIGIAYSIFSTVMATIICSIGIFTSACAKQVKRRRTTIINNLRNIFNLQTSANPVIVFIHFHFFIRQTIISTKFCQINNFLPLPH